MKKHYIPLIFLVLFFGISGFITFLRAAEIIYIEGTVQVQTAREETWRNAVKGMKVNIGDSIRTARHSKADVALDETKKNIFRIDPKTLVVLDSVSVGMIDRIDLSRGKVYSNLESVKAGLTFEVTTPSAVAGVRGSSYSVYTERDTDEVHAYKDSVFVQTFDVDKYMSSELTLPEGLKTFVERFETAGMLAQESEREFERFDRIMEEITEHAEGKEGARAEREREEARARKEKAKEEAKPSVQQASEQGAIVEEVTEESKDLVGEQIAEDIIEKREAPCSW